MYGQKPETSGQNRRFRISNKKLLPRAVDDGKKGIGISCADEIGMI
ncbi:hypothetical protein [Bacillus sp. V2I10]|nr:hypothetical protein [Bacillus sp. V2I10]MDQ0860362.1 hypothetical protein [Bacillus sp. V2I10]